LNCQARILLQIWLDGLDFSFGPNYKNGEVASLRNYLMKYLAKTFIETIPDWSPEELVFNAIA
jgi:hypothetical protein